MIRRLRHSFGHRMPQIDYPRAAEPIGNAVNVHSATLSLVGRNDYDGGTAITPVVQPRPQRLARLCVRTRRPRSSRSEEGRGGTEGVSTWRSRWSPEQ